MTAYLYFKMSNFYTISALSYSRSCEHKNATFRLNKVPLTQCRGINDEPDHIVVLEDVPYCSQVIVVLFDLLAVEGDNAILHVQVM